MPICADAVSNIGFQNNWAHRVYFSRNLSYVLCTNAHMANTERGKILPAVKVYRLKTHRS